jgi:hypothetical protein
VTARTVVKFFCNKLYQNLLAQFAFLYQFRQCDIHHMAHYHEQIFSQD